MGRTCPSEPSKMVFSSGGAASLEKLVKIFKIPVSAPEGQPCQPASQSSKTLIIKFFSNRFLQLTGRAGHAAFLRDRSHGASLARLVNFPSCQAGGREVGAASLAELELNKDSVAEQSKAKQSKAKQAKTNKPNKKKQPTAPGVPKRSPIQVLTGPNVA